MTAITPDGRVQDLRSLKASPLRKIGYSLGDFSYNFAWYIVSALLLIFYTDVFLIPAAVVSLFVLLVRLTDAVVDPIVGSIADRTRSRWGRYRPWILFAPIVMGVAMTLTFWAHPTWPLGGKLVYAIVTFVVATVASTATNMPYGALNAAISLDTDERLSFASYRMVAASLGSTIVGFIVFPMISAFSGTGKDASPANGYLFTVPIICFITIVGFVICFLSTREVVQPATEQHPKMSQLWRSVGKNRPLQMVVIGFFLFGFVAYGRIAIMAYYFQYNLENVGLFGTFNLVATGTSVIGAVIAPFVLRLFPSGNKGRVIIVSAVIQALGFGLMFAAQSSLPLFFVFGAVAGLGQGIFSATIFGMVPDTVEYAEAKTGIRSAGFNYAFTSLALKWGGAAGPAALGLILAATGFVPNAAQKPEVLTAVAAMMTIVPALLTIIAAIPFLFYRLDRKTFNALVDEIQGRRELAVDTVDASGEIHPRR